MKINLIHPAHGTETEPLQVHLWPHEPIGEPLSHGQDGAEPLQDRSCPKPVRLSWNFEAGGRGESSPTFDVLIAQYGGLDRPRLFTGLKDCQVELSNLLLGTSYWWKVIARDGKKELCQSPVWRFVTHAAPPRWINVPGITNTRDIGGWELADGRRIRQSMIYRSSEMDNHLQITDEGKRILQQELNIRTDLDLRGISEPASAVLDSQRVEWINVPILPYEYICQPIVSDGYRRIFQVFADPARYPILVHCWGGADRTGTVIFLLLALLGQSAAMLALDYELTSFSVWGARSRHSDEFQALLFTLSKFAQADQKHDLKWQVEKYLLSISIRREQIDLIRELLIQ